MRDGDPEDRHDRVTDELLDSPAVALDDAPQVFEVPPHACAKRLGIGRLAERRRAHEIAEEHRDHLPLLARRLRRLAVPRRTCSSGLRRGSRPRSSANHGDESTSVPRREARRAPLAIGVPRRRCPSARAGKRPARSRWPPRPGGPHGEDLAVDVLDVSLLLDEVDGVRELQRLAHELQRLVWSPRRETTRALTALHLSWASKSSVLAMVRLASASASASSSRPCRNSTLPSTPSTDDRTPRSPIWSSTSCPRRSTCSARSRSPMTSSANPTSIA